MKDKEKSYTEKFKHDQKKLKERAKELFEHISPEDEPQSTGDPKKIFEDDQVEKKSE